MTSKKKLIRVTTVPSSLIGLLSGQLTFMKHYYEIIGITSPNEDDFLKKFTNAEEIEIIPVEMTRKITPLKDFLALIRLYKIFRKEQPFIVHSHTPKAGTLSMLAAKLAGVPHRLHTIAGLPLLEAKGLKRVLLNQVEKITYACATKIYPNSFGLKDIILEEKFTNANKIKVIGNGSSNGIDTSFFDSDLISLQEKNALKQHLGLTNKDFVFVFIGRLVTDKGINELIKAFVEINKQHPHTKLLLVGDYETVLDPISTYSMETIKTHKNIVPVGWQDDVRPYFAISHALVFPSYREGFPNVVLQAGAMKLPCIVSNINGCNEIISDNVNGFIIPVKNTESLIIHMERLYAMNPEDLHIMGKKSREMIISKFERKFVWDCLLNEYQQIENKLEPNFKTTI